eukprot:UC1_evm1s1661
MAATTATAAAAAAAAAASPTTITAAAAATTTSAGAPNTTVPWLARHVAPQGLSGASLSDVCDSLDRTASSLLMQALESGPFVQVVLMDHSALVREAEGAGVGGRAVANQRYLAIDDPQTGMRGLMPRFQHANGSVVAAGAMVLSSVQIQRLASILDTAAAAAAAATGGGGGGRGDTIDGDNKILPLSREHTAAVEPRMVAMTQYGAGICDVRLVASQAVRESYLLNMPLDTQPGDSNVTPALQSLSLRHWALLELLSIQGSKGMNVEPAARALSSTYAHVACCARHCVSLGFVARRWDIDVKKPSRKGSHEDRCPRLVLVAAGKRAAAPTTVVTASESISAFNTAITPTPTGTGVVTAPATTDCTGLAEDVDGGGPVDHYRPLLSDADLCRLLHGCTDQRARAGDVRRVLSAEYDVTNWVEVLLRLENACVVTSSTVIEPGSTFRCLTLEATGPDEWDDPVRVRWETPMATQVFAELKAAGAGGLTLRALSTRFDMPRNGVEKLLEPYIKSGCIFALDAPPWTAASIFSLTPPQLGSDGGAGAIFSFERKFVRNPGFGKNKEVRRSKIINEWVEKDRVVVATGAHFRYQFWERERDATPEELRYAVVEMDTKTVKRLRARVCEDATKEAAKGSHSSDSTVPAVSCADVTIELANGKSRQVSLLLARGVTKDGPEARAALSRAAVDLTMRVRPAQQGPLVERIFVPKRLAAERAAAVQGRQRVLKTEVGEEENRRLKPKRRRQTQKQRQQRLPLQQQRRQQQQNQSTLNRGRTPMASGIGASAYPTGTATAVAAGTGVGASSAAAATATIRTGTTTTTTTTRRRSTTTTNSRTNSRTRTAVVAALGTNVSRKSKLGAREVRIEFGYARRYDRARLLHLFLFWETNQRITAAATTTAAAAAVTISSTSSSSASASASNLTAPLVRELLYKLPLQTFLQVVGQAEWLGGLKTLVRSDTAQATPLGELPREWREALMHENVAAHVNRVRETVQTLADLRLLSAGSSQGSSGFVIGNDTRIELKKTAPPLTHGSSGMPLGTAEEIEAYWVALAGFATTTPCPLIQGVGDAAHTRIHNNRNWGNMPLAIKPVHTGSVVTLSALGNNLELPRSPAESEEELEMQRKVQKEAATERRIAATQRRVAVAAEKATKAARRALAQKRQDTKRNTDTSRGKQRAKRKAAAAATSRLRRALESGSELASSEGEARTAAESLSADDMGESGFDSGGGEYMLEEKYRPESMDSQESEEP